MGHSPHGPLRFKQFEIDVGRASVRVSGRPIELRPKAFELLRFLAENPDCLHSKDELCAVLWPKTAVSDDSLAQLVRELRERLGDHAHVLIRTVPRRGYLLEADPEAFDQDAQPPEGPTTPRFAASPRMLSRTSWGPLGWITAGVVLGAVLLGGAWSLTPQVITRQAAEASPLSLAVLPFSPGSADADGRRISENLTDALTVALARLAPGYVAARGSAAGHPSGNAEVRQVGRELAVRYVIEGSIRRSGERVAISTRLIHAETAGNVWADTVDIDTSDNTTVAEDLASRLSRRIYAEMFRSEAARAIQERADKPTSMDYFIRGKALYHRSGPGSDLSEVRRLLEQALRLDPAMTMAWTSLAKAYLRNMRFSPSKSYDLKKAEEAAERAVALRPQSSDARIVRGWVRYEQLRLEDALVEFEHALRLDPRNVDALSSIASAQTALGRPEAALTALRQAMRLSPTDFDLARWQRFMGVAHLQLGQDQDAVVWLRKAAVLNPRDPLNHLYLASALAHSKLESEARASLVELNRIAPQYTLRKFIASEPSNYGFVVAQRQRIYEGMRMAGLPES